MDQREDGGGGTDELQVGMKVSSEAEAFNICNRYAIMKGFSLRKGNKRMEVTGKLRQRDFLCSKAGFQIDADLNEIKRGTKFETRTGCNALVRLTIEDGVWEITRLNSSHNHELATPEERQFLRSARLLQDYGLNVLSSKPNKSISYVPKEVGGVETVGISRTDGRNILQESGLFLEGIDVQSVINILKQKQVGDPNFFYTVQVDQFSRIKNFFWRDGKSKLDYDCFGDVVVFDTSFRMNKHTMICIPFLGVNHHWKNVLFGCAFLLDDSFETFCWLFESFLQSMRNRQPKTIFTDGQAMTNAVEKVFPKAQHQRGSGCALSIGNFSANVKSKQRSESTKNIFHQISKETTDLASFVHHYESKLEEMRLVELKDDFRGKHKEPHVIVRSGMLIHASTVYTSPIYTFFEKEFLSCMGVRMKQISNDGGIDIYETKEEDHSHVFIVRFNSLNGTVCCTCKLFESMGLLCRHALKVLDLKNFTNIPGQYILKRWTKEAKRGIVLRNLGESSTGNLKSAQSLRFSELMHEGTNVFGLGSLTESGTNIVREKLAEAMRILEEDAQTMNKMGRELEERKKKAPKLENASYVSQPTDILSVQLNQAIDSQTSYEFLIHQDGVLSDPDFDDQG